VLNQTARVALPGAWYPAPFFWHMGCVGVATIAHKRKLKISFPQLSGHAKPTEASGSITVSEPDAR